MLITFDDARHAYTLDGKPAPSVTEVLAAQNDWSKIPAWQLEAARVLGRDVHAAVNLYARGALDMDALDPAVRPYVEGAAMFLRASGATVIAAEQRVASKVYGVAGTLDALLEWDNYRYFVDWKVSSVVPSTVGAQLAAYELLYDETFNGGKKQYRTRRLCVRLRHNDYSTQRMLESHGDLSLFKSCLNAYKHRERAKYA